MQHGEETSDRPLRFPGAGEPEFASGGRVANPDRPDADAVEIGLRLQRLAPDEHLDADRAHGLADWRGRRVDVLSGLQSQDGLRPDDAIGIEPRRPLERDDGRLRLQAHHTIDDKRIAERDQRPLNGGRVHRMLQLSKDIAA
jgi:hypothetical protein